MKNTYDQYGNPLMPPTMKNVDAMPPQQSGAVPHVQSLKPTKPPTTGWRDLPFAIFFLIVVIATIALGVVWGIPVIKGTHSTQADSTSFLSKNESVSILTIGLVGCLVAGVLSFLMLNLMVRFAKKMITFALWFQVGLSGAAAIMGFASGAYVVGVLGLILFGLGIWYAFAVRHRIDFAKANLEVAAKAIRHHGSTHLIAFLFLFVQIIWIVVWFFALLGVLDHTNSTSHSSSNVRGSAANGEMCQLNADCESGYCNSNGICVQGSIKSISFVAYFFLLLALYWGLSVFKNLSHCTIAGTVATWWYSADSAGATASSLKRSCTTSLGSICLGSLLVAILQALRQIAESARQDGSILGCIAECILGCLQNLLEYFNRWAFVYVGIYGYKYVESGKAVMSLFRSRGFDAIINDDLIQNVLSLAALAVGILCAGLCVGVYYLHKDILAASGAPVILGIVGFIIGFGVSAVPLSVIDSAVATVFVCFAEDPVAFAASHGELYTPLVREWQKVYPDVILANGYYV